jgi:hypothetical protein
MGEVTTYNKVRTIAKRIDANTSPGIITIYENLGNQNTVAGTTTLSINAFIKNLKAFTRINSLSPIKLPNFRLEDSETDKLYKTLDIEWNSARKQLNLFISDSSQWELVGSVSLLNPSGYPYRMVNLMDLYTDNLAIELGENGKLGVQIQDVGYGSLTGNDLVTIHGSYVEEIVIDKSDIPLLSQCTSHDWTVNTISQTLLPANSSRTYCSIVNASSVPVFISLGNPAELGKGVLLSAYGSSLEISNQSGIFKGAINAISEGQSTLSGVECI